MRSRVHTGETAPMNKGLFPGGYTHKQGWYRGADSGGCGSRTQRPRSGHSQRVGERIYVPTGASSERRPMPTGRPAGL